MPFVYVCVCVCVRVCAERPFGVYVGQESSMQANGHYDDNEDGLDARPLRTNTHAHTASLHPINSEKKGMARCEKLIVIFLSANKPCAQESCF